MPGIGNLNCVGLTPVVGNDFFPLMGIFKSFKWVKERQIALQSRREVEAEHADMGYHQNGNITH